MDISRSQKKRLVWLHCVALRVVVFSKYVCISQNTGQLENSDRDFFKGQCDIRLSPLVSRTLFIN